MLQPTVNGVGPIGGDEHADNRRSLLPAEPQASGSPSSRRSLRRAGARSSPTLSRGTSTGAGTPLERGTIGFATSRSTSRTRRPSCEPSRPCEAEFGPLTGLVNSAGIGRDVPALDTSVDLFRKILEVNLIGSFVVSREAAQRMRARGGGSIVNIASVSGFKGNTGRVAYGASKAGVIHMTKVMAVELASLGSGSTPLLRAPSRRRWCRRCIRRGEGRLDATVPQRRYGTPDEIAGAAIFLLDDRKSSYVTGQTICVDGGFTAAGIIGGTDRRRPFSPFS